MKVLIIGFTKIKYMPYLNFYYDNLDKHHAIHVLFWNRDLAKEDLTKFSEASLHEFKYKLNDEDNYIKKSIAFIKYKQYAEIVIKKEKFDFVIVMHTLPAVLLKDLLVKKYHGKFILDYRDSTYEGVSWFQNAINKIVASSKCVFISSDGFKRFMPDDFIEKVYTSHNLLEDSLNHRDDKYKYGIKSQKIRIAFWGFIRHKDINIEIIKKLSNDDRFELHYYGREQDTALALKEYVKNTHAKNVFFHGEYKPEERYNFILNTDIIHNIYHDNNTMLAMGNKYYDGIIFKIPQLCMSGSYMGKRCTMLGIGLECDPYDDDFCDNVYEYYTNLSNGEFIENCDKECSRVITEYQKGSEIIRSLC